MASRGVDLTVAVCSVDSRFDTFGVEIQRQLYSQLAAMSPADQERVEILVLTDNRQSMLGAKRNALVDLAQGRWISFADDDDRLEPDYLQSILDATASDADAITFLVSVSIDGGEPKICRYSSIDFDEDHNTDDEYHRLCNHIPAVKRGLALKVGFPSIPYGEDSGYAKLLKPLIRTEHAIDRPLYHYDACAATSVAQKPLSAPLRRRELPPLVDVVMLSNAFTDELQTMTQHAIDTCIAGANSLSVNVMVLEQQPGIVYRHAKTLGAPAEFHYNAFANAGARRGSADWIMVANNDLIFHDGWLHALLAANHLVVSPRCPKAHADVKQNRSGYRTAADFAGWCFMIRRSLWESLGGFDESVSCWCSDDVVIQQLKSVDVEPMLVANSTVEHLGSVTIQRTADPLQELTWGQIERFNARYGDHPLTDSPEYHRWLAPRGR